MRTVAIVYTECSIREYYDDCKALCNLLSPRRIVGACAILEETPPKTALDYSKFLTLLFAQNIS